MLHRFVGQTAYFYGLNDITSFRFGEHGFRVHAESVDEMTSFMSSVEVFPGADFPLSEPFARLTLEPVEDYLLSGYRLVDFEGQTWLEFGTDNGDPSFPSFVFRYTPAQAYDSRIRLMLQTPSLKGAFL